MGEVVIRVENLSKLYRIGERIPYKTLRDSIANVFASSLRKMKRSQKAKNEDPNYIWALKDVSFEVKKSEVIGVIGRNGAGKTTLLKILSRITSPTEGQAKVCGRVASLLEVGTGFHPELTGRDNVYLSGAILGMKRQEIRRKFDEIVSFAEVERFIDTPLKYYSSGMYVRLAFAVAAHLEPEILLVDEVLAVGDFAFQRKCLGKMEDAAKGGRTVLFVSHNMAAVNRLCQKTVWLNEGRLQEIGITESVVAAYLYTGTETRGEVRWENLKEALGNEQLRLRAVRIRNSEGKISSSVDMRYQFYVELEYDIFCPLSGVRVGFWLLTPDRTVIFAAGDNEDQAWEGKIREPGRYISRCEIPGKLFKAGEYLLTIGADIPSAEVIFSEEGVLRFHIEQTDISGPMVSSSERLPGIICPPLQWNISKI